MDADRKLRMFRLLVKMGYKEIEIGFPAASQTDFDFMRKLIVEGPIPDDVTVQVLTQSRERADHAHVRGAGRCRGARSCISTTRRRRRSAGWCSGSTATASSRIAVTGAKLIRDFARAHPNRMGPRVFARELHRHRARFRGGNLRRGHRRLVADAARKIILNLPSTVELRTPNIYRRPDRMDVPASRAPRQRHRASVHPHNDRGCGIASAELALMAGAERVEGCLFGNGERTGNVCLVTLGLNLFTQGVDPGIDFSDINEVIRTVEYCNQLPVAPAASLWRRARVHGVLRFAPGRDQEGARGPRAGARARQRRMGRAVPADRSGRCRPHATTR